MGYRLCMAEKPSVAKDIARVIGADEKCDGYYRGNGYIVTWALGHLIALAEPEEYGYVPRDAIYAKDRTERDAARERAYAELPFIPDDFKLVVIPEKREQFSVVKKLLHDPDVDTVINCGDMGPEGHVLQWLIREKAGCDKPVLRFCATSMTDEAITDAMAHLRHEEEFADIVRGEFCKKKADWMLGMSLSRCATIKYNSSITVGRVQSPTLFFIVKRYLDVVNFTPTDYYGMQADLKEGFSVFWNKDTENAFPGDVKDDAGRLLDRAAAERKAGAIEADGSGTVVKVETKKKGKNPPQLYDITELERDANRRYGYTAAVTLAAAQALYETQKVTTYPRTDSRYITSDLAPLMQERVEAIGKLNGTYAEAVSRLGDLNFTSRIVDDSKVEDHHAIVPTERIKGFRIDEMEPRPDEVKKGVTKEVLRNVLDLILTRTITAFGQVMKYEQTDVAVKFGDITFSSSGTRILDEGWKGLDETMNGKEPKDEDAEGDEEQIFPGLSEGQTVSVDGCAVKPKRTSPPKLHTEATLLTAMENAGRSIENGKILDGKGIGTQATRAGIIEKMFSYGYCETKKQGKTNYIVPTAKGMNIIKILPEELYSPKITADWEERISEIAEGRMEPEEFMGEFKTFLKDETEKIKASTAEISFYMSPDEAVVCPWCGKELRRYQDNKTREVRYYCDRDCGFSLSTGNRYFSSWLKRDIKDKELVAFIRDGKAVLAAKKVKGKKASRIEFTMFPQDRDGKKSVGLKGTPVK